MGDESLMTAYNGLNVLLRQDLTWGSLKRSEMTAEMLTNCKCDNQYLKVECAAYYIKDERDVPQIDQQYKQSQQYKCLSQFQSRWNIPQLTNLTGISHSFISDIFLPLSDGIIRELKSRLPSSRSKSYKPIPVITGFSMPMLSPSLSAAALTTLTKTLDSTLPKHKTPILHVGPPAAGHQLLSKDIARSGNTARWSFSKDTQLLANERDVEWLGLWNLTIQAESLDGFNYGGKVAIVEAMMVRSSLKFFCRWLIMFGCADHQLAVSPAFFLIYRRQSSPSSVLIPLWICDLCRPDLLRPGLA